MDVALYPTRKSRGGGETNGKDRKMDLYLLWVIFLVPDPHKFGLRENIICIFLFAFDSAFRDEVARGVTTFVVQRGGN